MFMGGFDMNAWVTGFMFCGMAWIASGRSGASVLVMFSICCCWLEETDVDVNIGISGLH